MSARKTAADTTCGERAPAAVRIAPMFSNTCRVWASMPPATSAAGGRVERHLTGDEQQLAGPDGLRVGPDGGRGAGVVIASRIVLLTHQPWPSGLRRRLDDLARAQAARADANPPDAAIDHGPDRCRFGSNRRAVTLCAWLCCVRRPGPFRRLHIASPSMLTCCFGGDFTAPPDLAQQKHRIIARPRRPPSATKVANSVGHPYNHAKNPPENRRVFARRAGV